MTKQLFVQYLEDHDLFDAQFQPFTLETLRESYPLKMRMSLSDEQKNASGQSASYFRVLDPKVTVLVALRNTLRQLNLEELSDKMAAQYLKFLRVIQDKAVHYIFSLLDKVSDCKPASPEETTIKELAGKIKESFSEADLIKANGDSGRQAEGCLDYSSEEGAFYFASIKEKKDALDRFHKNGGLGSAFAMNKLLEEYAQLPCISQLNNVIVLQKDRANIALVLGTRDLNPQALKKELKENEKFLQILRLAKADLMGAGQGDFSGESQSVPVSRSISLDDVKVFLKKRDINFDLFSINKAADEQEELKIGIESRITFIEDHEKKLSELTEKLKRLSGSVLIGLKSHERMLEKKLELLTDMRHNLAAVTEYIEALVRWNCKPEENSHQFAVDALSEELQKSVAETSEFPREEITEVSSVQVQSKGFLMSEQEWAGFWKPSSVVSSSRPQFDLDNEEYADSSEKVVLPSHKWNDKEKDSSVFSRFKK